MKNLTKWKYILTRFLVNQYLRLSKTIVTLFLDTIQSDQKQSTGSKNRNSNFGTIYFSRQTNCHIYPIIHSNNNTLVYQNEQNNPLSKIRVESLIDIHLNIYSSI